VSMVDYVLWDPVGAVSFVLGCLFAWFLAPAFELTGASARVERLRDLRPGHWLAVTAALLGVVADSAFFFRYFGGPSSVWLGLCFVPISVLVPGVLVVAGASLRPSRRVALILIGVFWTLAAAWLLPDTMESNALMYRYGLIPHSIIDAFIDASQPVSYALISVCAGIAIQWLSRGMGRGGVRHQVLPVPPEA